MSVPQMPALWTWMTTWSGPGGWLRDVQQLDVARLRERLDDRLHSRLGALHAASGSSFSTSRMAASARSSVLVGVGGRQVDLLVRADEEGLGLIMPTPKRNARSLSA